MKSLILKILLATITFTYSNYSTHSQEINSTSCAEIITQILNKNREMEAAFNINDMLKLASFYSDSSILIGEKLIVKGREQVDSYWMSLRDKGVSWNLENIKIDFCDSIAVQQGISRLVYSTQGQKNISVVRFTLVWKQVNDDWFIEIDHYSTI
jgi:ketosteroid isomerase-like protein